MRSRLVAAFVLVSVALLVTMTLVRAFTLATELREDASRHVAREALALGTVLEGVLDAGARVDSALLEGYVADDGLLRYVPPGGDVGDAAEIVVAGRDFDLASDLDHAVSSTVPVAEGALTVSQVGRGWWGTVGYSPVALVALLLLLTALAALAGYATSRVLAGPFTQLARAAAMLGRGRFDLDLPITRIPEVRAVSAALEASAAALRERLLREQQFSVHASHVLRTPLTSLRLHLDELQQEDLDLAARAATQRCLRSVDELQQVVGDLVDLTRRDALMSGAEIPLRDLAAEAAQRWADVLSPSGRRFSAAVDGELDMTLTPGPVEYVLDVLLDEARRSPQGDVRLVLIGAPGVLRIEVIGVTVRLPHPVTVPSAAAAPVDPADQRPSRVDQAVSLVRSLGGRVETLPDGAGSVVLMPPR